jgi:hypothetical protein
MEPPGTQSAKANSISESEWQNTTQTQAPNRAPNEHVSWEDDDFDDAFVSVSRITKKQDTTDFSTRGIMSTAMAESKSPSHSQAYDGWLGEAPRCTTKQEDDKDQEQCLTRQFRSLNTPASRKKHRYLECTRPLVKDNEM